MKKHSLNFPKSDTSHLIQEIILMSKKIPVLLLKNSSSKIQEFLQMSQTIHSFIKNAPLDDSDLDASLRKLQFLQEVNLVLLQKKSEYFTFLFRCFDKNENCTYTKIGTKKKSTKSAAIKTLV